MYGQNIAPEKYNNTIHFTFKHSYRDKLRHVDYNQTI